MTETATSTRICAPPEAYGFGGDPDRRLRRRNWEVRAQSVIDRIRALAIEAERSRRATDGAGEAFCVRYGHVLAQLDESLRYLDMKGSLRGWWLSTRVEGTWRHVHTATIGLVSVATEAQLQAISPFLLSEIDGHLRDGDPERRAVQSWFDALPRIVAPPLGSDGGQAPPPPPPAPPAPPPPPGRPVRYDAADRGALQAALTTAYTRTDAEYQRLRRFQWTITGCAVLAFALVGTLAWLGRVHPQVVPLCFPDPDSAATTTAAPTTTTAPPTTADTTGTAAPPAAPTTTAATAAADGAATPPVCPSRDRATATTTTSAPAPAADGDVAAAGGPATRGDAAAVAAAAPATASSSPGDVATVLFYGLVGAVLTSVPFLVRQAPPTTVPISSVRVAQAALKVAMGMLGAVVGLLILRAGVIPGFTAIDTRAQVLVYALVFGASQQLATRLIDKRSDTLVSSFSSEESSAS
jgi:hypothetical protein